MKHSRHWIRDRRSAKRSRHPTRDPERAIHRAGPWDRRKAGDTAQTLFLRGREAENAGDFDAAVSLYASALATPEAERHPADTAAILHHVGNCSSATGDKEAAWELYLGSARHVHERCDEGHREKGVIASSLGEAGLLLVDYRPPVPIREAVSHALLLGGVTNALDHAAEVLLGSASPTKGAAMTISRKLTGLMVLASGAAADVILANGALALYERVALPFAERHGFRQRPMDDTKLIASVFEGLAFLYQAVGEQERPERMGVPPTRREVEELTSFATFAFAGAPPPLMLRWLGSFLRDRRGAAWATDKLLAEMGQAG